MAVSAECLGAIQHPAIFSTYGVHTCAPSIRTGRGLGQSPSTDVLACGQLAHILLFLLFVAGQENMIGAQRGVCRHDDAHRAVHAREFFNRSDVLDVAHAGPAVLRWKHHAQEAELAELFDSGQGELSRLVPFHDVGRNFAFGKLAHTLLELKLFFVELKVQYSSACLVSCLAVACMHYYDGTFSLDHSGRTIRSGSNRPVGLNGVRRTNGAARISDPSPAPTKLQAEDR